MSQMSRVQGNERNLRLLSESYIKGKLSHAYIIEGSELSGRDEFIQSIAAALLCEKVTSGAEKGELVPCGKCPSCIKAATRNHPDIIHVRHAKPTVLSVDEIRDQVVADISIKPYYGPYKIYIIYDAQLMNENAQNALLKTIEEPEPYGIIFLLTDNEDSFLQTIRSRCIRLSMDAVSRDDIAEALLDEDGQQVLKALEDVSGMDALQINKTAKEMEAMDRQNVIKIARLWLRDILVYKSTGDEGKLYFTAHAQTIRSLAAFMTYEGINECLEAVDEVQARLSANVKAEAAFENMMLQIRRRTKAN